MTDGSKSPCQIGSICKLPIQDLRFQCIAAIMVCHTQIFINIKKVYSKAFNCWLQKTLAQDLTWININFKLRCCYETRLVF